MKTIEPPQLPKPESRFYRIRCQNRECKALLEMGHPELHHGYDPKDHEEFHQFTCPHCSKVTTVYKLRELLVPTGPIPRGVAPVTESRLEKAAEDARKMLEVVGNAIQIQWIDDVVNDCGNFVGNVVEALAEALED